jgi:hypothetical protein
LQVTAHRLRALIGATWKTIPWAAVALSGSAALLLAGIPAVAAKDIGPGNHVQLLRAAALAGAIGAAFLLDDPAQATTSVTPTSRLVRHSVRVLLALPLVTTWWAAILAITWFGTDEQGRAGLPLVAVSLETATLIVLTLAISSALSRRGRAATISSLAVPAVLVLVCILMVLPPAITPVVAYGAPRWGQAHRVWGVLLSISTAAFIACSHEYPRPGPEAIRRRR